MSTLETTIRLVAGLLLVLANAFFVVTEFALTRIPQFDEEEFQQSRGLRRAWAMTEQLEIYLTGCQVGITICSVLLGIVAEPAVSAVIGPVIKAIGLAGGVASVGSVVLAVLVINLVHTIWGEQASTYLGVERPKQIARFTAPVHYWWTKMTYPFIFLSDKVAKATLRLFGVQVTRSWTDEEAEGGEDEEGAPRPVSSRADLKRRMSGMLRQSDVPSDRREEVMNALTIGERPVREIMVPRKQVAVLSTRSTAEENLRVIAEHAHSRFPVTDGPMNGSLDRFVGILYVPALFREREALHSGTLDWQAVAAPPLTVEAGCPISQFVDRLQREEQEAALVEEDGRPVGLATLTDAFEAIAGELHDPLD